DRYLARALEAQPSAAAVRTELGITRLVLGQTEAGIAALEEASLQDPGTLRPEIALFIAYFKQKDFDKALETAKRLEKASPREAVGVDFAGAALLAVANDGAARAEFQRALELHPNDAVATRSLAVIATRAGDVAAATKIYGDMLLINPRDSNASVALAELYKQQGQPAAAVAVLQKAIEQGPENIAPRVSI